MRRRLVSLAALALGLSLAGPGQGAIALRYDLAGLVQAADRVAVVEVLATRTAWRGGRLVTRVTLAPHTGLKGPTDGPFELEVAGGERDGLGQLVQGAARFTEGELAVVFTQRAAGVERLVGMAQGKLQVQLDPHDLRLVSDLRGLTTATLTPDGGWQVAPPALPARVPLAALLAELSALAAEPRP